MHCCAVENLIEYLQTGRPDSETYPMIYLGQGGSSGWVPIRPKSNSSTRCSLFSSSFQSFVYFMGADIHRTTVDVNRTSFFLLCLNSRVDRYSKDITVSYDGHRGHAEARLSQVICQ